MEELSTVSQLITSNCRNKIFPETLKISMSLERKKERKKFDWFGVNESETHVLGFSIWEHGWQNSFKLCRTHSN